MTLDNLDQRVRFALGDALVRALALEQALGDALARAAGFEEAVASLEKQLDEARGEQEAADGAQPASE